VALHLARQLRDLDAGGRDREGAVDRPAPRGGKVAAAAARLEVGEEHLRVLVDEMLGAKPQALGALVGTGGTGPPGRAARDLLQQGRRRGD
jgi:hypothetical protein